ncbi:unnamed protein product [Oppiella nova]|uniref:4-hydroxy-2-oxoglutarate aldolase, mitochondrial n=1 Tax=Oppiella nova TaxID=334625 RepID=A0A7R9Q8M0_9ACAR|nr:unnamed protein product [Oppiella nova]CAG2157403.1 unnamed protein product [Oppiella nova]
MFEDGSVDWKGLEKLVEWHIEQGTNSIVAVGTTGEASTLSMAEHTEVIKEIIRVANKRIPIIAGTGANSTHEAIELTKEAKQLGADAALLVTPYYNKPTQEGLFQHYKAVAEAVDLPIILYNVPGRTGVDLHNDTAIRLADIPQIVGIKDATGDVPRGKELIDGLKGKNMVVYSGDDATASELIQLGAHGNISNNTVHHCVKNSKQWVSFNKSLSHLATLKVQQLDLQRQCIQLLLLTLLHFSMHQNLKINEATVTRFLVQMLLKSVHLLMKFLHQLKVLVVLKF